MRKLLSALIVTFVITTIYCFSAIAETPKHKTVWKIKKGMTLSGIAKMTYGHWTYFRMIYLYNRLDPVKPLQIGTVIHTPPLPDMFRKLGLFHRYSKQFKRIFYVITRYRALLPEYYKLREAAKGYSQPGHMRLPQHLKNELLRLAIMLYITVGDIKKMTAKTGNSPKHMLQRLTAAADWIRYLAQGNMDGYGYDEDMVEQNIAYALANAVAWSRE